MDLDTDRKTCPPNGLGLSRERRTAGAGKRLETDSAARRLQAIVRRLVEGHRSRTKYHW
jgi:hypothetical protein